MTRDTLKNRFFYMAIYFLAFTAFLSTPLQAGEEKELDKIETAATWLWSDLDKKGSSIATYHFFLQGLSQKVEHFIKLGEERLEAIVAKFEKGEARSAGGDIDRLRKEFKEDQKNLLNLLKMAGGFKKSALFKSKYIQRHGIITKRIYLAAAARRLIMDWEKHLKDNIPKPFKESAAKNGIWKSWSRVRSKLTILHIRFSAKKITETEYIKGIEKARIKCHKIKQDLLEAVNPKNDKSYLRIFARLRKISNSARNTKFTALVRFMEKFDDKMERDIVKFKEDRRSKDILSWPKGGKIVKLIDRMEKKLSERNKVLIKYRKEVEELVQERDLDGRREKGRTKMRRYESYYDKMLGKDCEFEFHFKETADWAIKYGKVLKSEVENDKAKVVKKLGEVKEIIDLTAKDKEILKKIGQARTHFERSGRKEWVKYMNVLEKQYKEDAKALKKIGKEIEEMEDSDSKHYRALKHFDTKMEFITEAARAIHYLSSALIRAVKKANKGLTVLPYFTDFTLSGSGTIIKGVTSSSITLLEEAFNQKLEKIRDHSLSKRCGVKVRFKSEAKEQLDKLKEAFGHYDEIDDKSYLSRGRKIVKQTFSTFKNIGRALTDKEFRQNLKKGEITQANRRWDALVPYLRSVEFDSVQDLEAHIKQNFIKKVAAEAEKYLNEVYKRASKIDDIDQKAGLKDIHATVERLKEILEDIDSSEDNLLRQLKDLRSAMER